MNHCILIERKEIEQKECATGQREKENKYNKKGKVVCKQQQYIRCLSALLEKKEGEIR